MSYSESHTQSHACLLYPMLNFSSWDAGVATDLQRLISYIILDDHVDGRVLCEFMTTRSVASAQRLVFITSGIVVSVLERRRQPEGHQESPAFTTMKPKSELQPADCAHPRSFSPPTARSRFARLLLLLSAAGTLSYFLPGLWTRDVAVSERVESPLAVDPASEWRDNVWPLREQTPWDISTDFPFPRKIEYTVTEGTWLRLDVHPKNGDVVFDMLGDIYCLPGEAYLANPNFDDAANGAKARPVLVGVPHDSDPHFSPAGDKLVFRSDAGLGVENIWVTEWKGCDGMDVRPTVAEGELLDALEHLDEEDMLANGLKETELRKQRRLVREGRLRGELPVL